MAHTNEEATTMNANEQNDEDNLSLEEWTLLDKASNDSIRRTVSIRKNTNPPKVHADVREAIQELEQSLLAETAEENKDDINRVASFVGRDEDSDGVSVISESDKQNDECQISNISTVIRSVDNFIVPVETFIYIIVACSLAAVMGCGVGYIIANRGTQLFANNNNFEHAKSTQCTEQLKKKTFVPDISIEAILRTILEDTLKQLSHDEYFINVHNNDELEEVGSFLETLGKIKVSHDILCAMIDNTHTSRNSNEYITGCAEPLSVVNLIELRDSMQNVIKDIGYVGDSSNKWFMEYMESNLKNISLSLFNDLSKTIKESVTKTERKLSKMRHKLNRRLCLILNTVGDDAKIEETLNKYNLLKENCQTQKFTSEVESARDIQRNFENKNKNMEKHIRTYPIGPEVNVRVNKEKLKVQAEYLKKDNRKKERMGEDEPGKFYKSKRDHKSRKDFLKGDFTSDRDTVVLHKDKIQGIHRPIVAATNIVNNYPDDQRDIEEFCDSNLCSKQRPYEKKNSRDETYANWQFKRSEGRFNWREEKQVGRDEYEPSWVDKRAKGRKNARQNY